MGNTQSTSDAKYAEELLFQEALMASARDHRHYNIRRKAQTKQAKETGESSRGFCEICMEKALMASARDHRNYNIRRKDKMSSSNLKLTKQDKKTGESSNGFCEICMENKERYAMIPVQICGHSFCSECIIKYVEVQIQGRSVGLIKCPGLRCKGVIEPDTWRSIISKDMIDIYNDNLCELSILDSQKFYCPFKNCSALMENDHKGSEVIRQSECPACRRLFCAACRVAWHAGIGCEEFQKLKEDERGSEDLKVKALAKKKKWNRCHSCSMYVEKNEGCQHITCRCGAEWCYKCGKNWKKGHKC